MNKARRPITAQRPPDDRHGQPSGGQRQLGTALRRFAQALVPTVGADQEAPPPETDWQRAMELRVSKLEQATNAQNRLLLLTLISILAEFLYGLRMP